MFKSRRWHFRLDAHDVIILSKTHRSYKRCLARPTQSHRLHHPPQHNSNCGHPPSRKRPRDVKPTSLLRKKKNKTPASDMSIWTTRRGSQRGTGRERGPCLQARPGKGCEPPTTAKSESVAIKERRFSEYNPGGFTDSKHRAPPNPHNPEVSNERGLGEHGSYSAGTRKTLFFFFLSFSFVYKSIPTLRRAQRPADSARRASPFTAWTAP